jgi:hypothetical protein
MVPVRGHNADAPPSNFAQLDMGWNIATKTIDLGLGLFDVFILVGDWIDEYVKRKAAEAKAAEITRRSKRRGKPNQPRSLKLTQEDGFTEC